MKAKYIHYYQSPRMPRFKPVCPYSFPTLNNCQSGLTESFSFLHYKLFLLCLPLSLSMKMYTTLESSFPIAGSGEMASACSHLIALVHFTLQRKAAGNLRLQLVSWQKKKKNQNKTLEPFWHSGNNFVRSLASFDLLL